MCRQISFNMDYYYHLNNPNKVEKPKPYWTDWRRRQEEPRKTEDYSLENYVLYMFYVPLYLAGPVACFNSFVSYVRF